MQSLSPKQTQKIDGICQNLEGYLETRAEQTTRVNPELRAALTDMIWYKSRMVREAISNPRKFGSDAYLVADVLVSEDEQKKSDLLSAQSELSLWPVVGPGGDTGGAPLSQMDVGDLASLFELMDGSFAGLTRLVGLWAWWDLPDATDLLMIEQAFQRFDALRAAQIKDPVKQAYKSLLQKESADDVTQKEILAFELQKTQRILERMESRRDEEPVWRILLAHDASPDEALNSEILKLATHLTAINRLNEQEDFDPRARSYYAGQMGEEAKNVTRDSAIEYEMGRVSRLKGELIAMLREGGQTEPSPYDFKRRQIGEYRDRWNDNRIAVERL